MKEQYVGDINDYRKYVLLRSLCRGGGIRIGVCWLLTPPDGRADGGKRSYLREPHRWRHFDPQLFDLLGSIDRYDCNDRLRRIEKSGILPDALFLNDETPDDRPSRSAYIRRALTHLAPADLIFFDPDNGLDVKSVPVGSKNSSKFVYRDEISAAYGAGHSVLVYQHYPRANRERFTDALAGELARLLKPQSIWLFRTSHVLFLLLVHLSHASQLEAAARETSGRWSPEFLSGRIFDPADLDLSPTAQLYNVGKSALMSDAVSKPSENETGEARRRIWDEPINARIEMSDGTVIENGKVTKVGARAIVDPDGNFLGQKPSD